MEVIVVLNNFQLSTKNGGSHFSPERSNVRANSSSISSTTKKIKLPNEKLSGLMH